MAGIHAQEKLTWHDCLSETQKNNPDLVSAIAGVDQAKASKAITASALFPQVSADLAASTSKTRSSGSSATSDSYAYGVNGSQLLFDGGKTLYDINSADENIKAAQQNYRFTSSEVRYSLRSAFIAALKAQELIRVAEEIVKIRRDNVILITLQYQTGLEHRGALLTAEANVSQAQFELSQARRNSEFAQKQLSKKMGRTEFRLFTVRGDFTVTDPAIDKPDFEAIALETPAVRESLYRKNAALFGIRSARADFVPQLSGSASADKRSVRWPPRDEQWSAGLNVSMPLFEGGLKTAHVTQAKAGYAQAEADERSTRDSAVVELERSWAALQDALETVSVKGKVLEASLERSKIAQAQYATGFISFDNWIIIENDLVSSKKAYLEAQANALLAEASWMKAKGETIEYAQ